MHSQRNSDKLKHYQLMVGGVDYLPFYEAEQIDDGFGAMEVSRKISYTFNSKPYIFPTPTHLYWAIRCQELPDFETHLHKILTFPVPTENINNPEKLSDYVKKILGEENFNNKDKIYLALRTTIYERSRMDELFTKQLSDSGDAYLVYDSDNAVLGNGEYGQGSNLRGKAMMEVRERLKKGSAFDTAAFEKSFAEMRENAHSEMRELAVSLGAANVKGQGIPVLGVEITRPSFMETTPASSKEQEVITQEEKPESPASNPTSKTYKFKDGVIEYLPFSNQSDNDFGALGISLRKKPIIYQLNGNQYRFQTLKHYYWAIRLQQEYPTNADEHLAKIASFSMEGKRTALQDQENAQKAEDYAKSVLKEKESNPRREYQALVQAFYGRSMADPTFKSRLIASQGSYIVYDNDNPIWGLGVDGSGENLRGKAMMEAREQIIQGDAFNREAFNISFNRDRETARAEFKKLESQFGKALTDNHSIKSLAALSQKNPEEVRKPAPFPSVERYIFKGGSVVYSPINTKSSLGSIDLPGDRPIIVNIPQKEYSFPTPLHYYAALRLRHLSDYLRDFHFKIIEKLKTKQDVNNYLNRVFKDRKNQDANWGEKKQYHFLVRTYLKRAEFDANFKAQLLASGDSYIVFEHKDSRWGVGINGQGENIRGKALMEARERLFLGNDKFNEVSFRNYFEDLRDRAREERKRLAPYISSTGNVIPIKKLHQLSQDHPISIKDQSPIPVSNKGDQPTSNLTPTDVPPSIPATNKKKDGPSKRLIQDESEPEVPAEKISSSGPRIDLLSPKNLEIIKESLEKDLCEKSEKDTYTKSVKQEKTDNGVIFRVVVKDELKETNHSVKVHKNMISTTDNDVETFKMMIVALEKVHRLDFKPKVITQDEETRAKWIKAFKELGVYSHPEKFVHVNPEVHKQVHEERTTPTRRM